MDERGFAATGVGVVVLLLLVVGEETRDPADPAAAGCPGACGCTRAQRCWSFKLAVATASTARAVYTKGVT